FTVPGTDTPVKQKTELKVMFDDNNIYVGLKFYSDNIQAAEKGIALIKKTGPVGFLPGGKDYANQYGAELFFDPGSSGINYFQILFNGAGQCIGHKNAKWDNFDLYPKFASQIKDNCWTAEFVLPYKGLKQGAVWGFNVCRNDDTYYGIWKNVGADYNSPKKFGLLLFGDYRQWWHAEWEIRINDEFNRIKADSTEFSKNPEYLALFRKVQDKYDSVNGIAAQIKLDNKADFIRLYNEYKQFNNEFRRLKDLYELYGLMLKIK
ncbi:MAG: hypothetical protein NT118_01755, partial [Lentisphaerae bacterium]|nr:hypothetical protein [Lentisphaerota bacterium]